MNQFFILKNYLDSGILKGPYCQVCLAPPCTVSPRCSVSWLCHVRGGNRRARLG